jgi:hypothetical protein
VATHRDFLPLYKKAVVASAVFAVVVCVGLLTLGEVAGAIFLSGLVVLAVLIVVVGPRLVARRPRP